MNKTRSVGRPRSIALGEIIDAASEMGLGNFSMATLAARLGVGVGTIYRSVRSREELEHLVALRKSTVPLPADVGQSWQDVVRGYAEAIFSMLETDPDILDRFIRGGMGPRFEVDMTERFLRTMSRHGFTEPDAFDIFHLTRLVIAGAAMYSLHMKNAAAVGTSYESEAAAAIENRDPHEIAHLYRIRDAYSDGARRSDWRPGVDLVIAAYEHPIPEA